MRPSPLDVQQEHAGGVTGTVLQLLRIPHLRGYNPWSETSMQCARRRDKHFLVYLWVRGQLPVFYPSKNRRTGFLFGDKLNRHEALHIYCNEIFC